jgi:hypothetical protein
LHRTLLADVYPQPVFGRCSSASFSFEDRIIHSAGLSFSQLDLDLEDLRIEIRQPEKIPLSATPAAGCGISSASNGRFHEIPKN